MVINEKYEFKDKDGNEIEPTKEQLLTFISDILQKRDDEIKVLEKALGLACEEIKNRDNGFTSAGLKLQKIANEYGLDCKTYNAFFKEQAEKELGIKDD